MKLIVNLGLKSIRLIVFNSQGIQVYSSSRPVHTWITNELIEQDAIEWHNLLTELLNELNDKTNLIPQISQITSTTSSSCIFGIGQEGLPITKVMMVSDRRSSIQAANIKKLDTFKKLSKNSDIDSSPSYTLPKILWYQDNKKETFNHVNYWLGAGEFLNYYFTKIIFTDPLNASKAYYIESIKDYPNDLLKDLAIDKTILPPVKEIGTKVALSSEIISNFNFSQNCEYILTTYDAICAVIGSGNGLQNNACDVSGTVTSVRMMSDLIHNNNAEKESSVLLSHNVNILNKKIIGLSNNLGGGIIEWHKQAFFDENDKDVYFKMENEAYHSGIGSNGIIFLPYLLGERAPFKADYIKACFFGVARSSKLKDFTRAVLESTAFVTNDLIYSIKNSGYKPESLSVSGGLARFDIVNQIKADVTGLPVYVVENFESTSLGAFILLQFALGEYTNYKEVANNIIRTRKIINPNLRNVQLYKNIFELYQEIREKLLPLYKKHSELSIENTYKEIIKNL